MTAVQLDQHALPRHALAAQPVLGRTPSSWTAQTGVDQDAPQGGPADVDALALAQQLAEMGVVGPCVPGTSQTHYAGHQASGVALAGLRPRWPWVREAADRRQLVLPVATTILAGRDGQSSRPPASACAGHRLCRYTVRVNSIDTHHGSASGQKPPSVPRVIKSTACLFNARRAFLFIFLITDIPAAGSHAT